MSHNPQMSKPAPSPAEPDRYNCTTFHRSPENPCEDGCSCGCHKKPTPSPAFSELESAILQRLEKGPFAFTPLWLGLQSPSTRSDHNFFRKVDRALQKLRRGGFVHTDRRVGWSLK